MTTTRYTNCVLTIIALCLLAIAGRGLGILPDASAQNAGRGQPVVITGWQVSNDSVALPVFIKNPLVPVANGFGSTGKLVPVWTVDRVPN